MHAWYTCASVVYVHAWCTCIRVYVHACVCVCACMLKYVNHNPMKSIAAMALLPSQLNFESIKILIRSCELHVNPKRGILEFWWSEGATRAYKNWTKAPLCYVVPASPLTTETALLPDPPRCAPWLAAFMAEVYRRFARCALDRQRVVSKRIVRLVYNGCWNFAASIIFREVPVVVA